jgi:hypothetical protein
VPDDGFSIRCRSAPEFGQPSSSPPVVEIEARRSNLDWIRTARLLAERLTAAHLPDLRRIDQNEFFMAGLGGVRGEAGTRAYFDRNMAHWGQHGFGLWMLRDGKVAR